MELPTHFHEIQKALENNTEAFFQLMDFQKEIEQKGNMTDQLRLSFTEKIIIFTKEIVTLQERLIDCLKHQEEVDGGKS
jgi:hypothetical protein